MSCETESRIKNYGSNILGTLIRCGDNLYEAYKAGKKEYGVSSFKVLIKDLIKCGDLTTTANDFGDIVYVNISNKLSESAAKRMNERILVGYESFENKTDIQLSYTEFTFKFYVNKRDKELKKDALQECTCCNELKVATEFKKCSNCKVAYYCSAECQKKHWKQHKSYCYEVCPKKN
jgi:hypothetical protein